MSYKLFLDDLRQPTNIYPKTQDSDWVICRNLTEFKNAIETKGMPSFVSFDHDLNDIIDSNTENTGLTCAKFLANFCMDNNQLFPSFEAHSANPPGRDNIIGFIKSFNGRNDKKSQLREKIRGILLKEYSQQAEKAYFKTGALNDHDKEIILGITGSDNFTKIISDIYYAYKKQRHRDGGLSSGELSNLKSFYGQFKNYNKNVFPIKDLNINGVKNATELINVLTKRQEILDNMKLLPSVAIRNLKDDIRKPRDYKEFHDYEHYLKYFMSLYSMLSNRDEKMREAILRKAFKANTNIHDLVSFLDEKNNLLGGTSFTRKKIKEIVDSYNSESDIIFDKGNIMVVEVGGPTGMSKIGCNSVWCFSYGGGNNWNTWNNYSTNGVVYVIIDFKQKPDTIDFMHVLIKPIDWDENTNYEEDENYDSPLYSMDNEPIDSGSAADFLIKCVGGVEEAKKIFNFGEEYVSLQEIREKEKEIEDRAINVFREFYDSPDKPLPSFDEFFQKYIEFKPEEDSDDEDEKKLVRPEKEKEIVKGVLKKLTTNPHQMSLFELKLKKEMIKLIMEEENSEWWKNGDLIPPFLVDAFIKRINKRFEQGATKDHPSIERELNLIRQVNGDKIPLRIKELLDSK